MNNIVKSIKEVEAETLATFQEEIPSIYFSDKGDAEYLRYVSNAEFVYRECLKFPPQMFNGADMIDFGSGTGENTIYLANWGANCTLVEMNKKAQDISKKVFKKYARDFKKHSFITVSIFDYEPDNGKRYDIVSCRGVLSHTAAKEEAFMKIAGLVKPKGYLIFGDPNKAGGFQNMLQRFAVYNFASTPDEMVDICEFLFKEDIDRSQLFVPRTRRAIIFDRWVIQNQDDPSIAEVMEWIKRSGMRIYSSYPPFMVSLRGDSAHHKPKLDEMSLSTFGVLAELVWLLHTEADADTHEKFSNGLHRLESGLSELTKYVANFNKNTKINAEQFHAYSAALAASSGALTSFLNPLSEKLVKFLGEADKFVDLVFSADLQAVRHFIKESEVLFKGACGVRHVDFIAYKPTDLDQF